MSSASSARPTAWLVRAGIVAVWLLFMLMVLAISWGGAASRNRPFDFATNLVWNLGWLFWAGATFGVRALARRFPIERRQLATTLILHVAFGLAITTLLLTAEFFVNGTLQRLWPATVRPNPFVAFVVYKFHIYFLIYWLIIGATIAYDYYTQFQRSELLATQLEAELAQAQVQALKVQLHPHFLFNTHHAIVSLMLKQDNAAAIKMLTRLSDLLRVTLQKMDQPVSSLRDELAIVDLYLGIQQERYHDRLVVEIEVDPAVETAEVPCLLLQPLVENALQHGIDPQSSGGRLVIKARRSGDTLEIFVRDNGPGLPPDFTLEKSAGIGLRNTRSRLERLYGTQQCFTIGGAPGGGLVVRVELPFRRSKSTPVSGDKLVASP